MKWTSGRASKTQSSILAARPRLRDRASESILHIKGETLRRQHLTAVTLVHFRDENIVITITSEIPVNQDLVRTFTVCMSSHPAKQTNATKAQACLPCAKRKVRCDREEPCGNCKRRKNDQCTYNEVSPAERLKKLEALVRNLGGDPEAIDQVVQQQENVNSPVSLNRQVQAQNNAQKLSGYENSQEGYDTAIVKEQDESIYVES